MLAGKQVVKGKVDLSHASAFQETQATSLLCSGQEVKGRRTVVAEAAGYVARRGEVIFDCKRDWEMQVMTNRGHYTLEGGEDCRKKHDYGVLWCCC